MSDIGFIGLGIMGRPMATNLVRAGHRVLGYSRSERSRLAAAAVGVTPVDSIADVCAAQVVITMLPDSPDVVSVVLGEGGLRDGLRRGALHIDMSTIAPEAARRVHEQLHDAGIDSLDAPVSGGEAAAVEGTLSVMVGGAAPTLERAHATLAPMAATITHVGGAGAGQVVKAANQVMVAGHIQMLSEALLLLRAHGVELPTAVAALQGGLAGSTVMARKAQGMIDASFDPGFRAELHHKDLGIACNAAREAGVGLPATALVSSLLQAVVARGDGAFDHSVLYRALQEAHGVVGGAA